MTLSLVLLHLVYCNYFNVLSASEALPLRFQEKRCKATTNFSFLQTFRWKFLFYLFRRSRRRCFSKASAKVDTFHVTAKLFATFFQEIFKRP